MTREQPDKERCGTGDRGRATYRPRRSRVTPPTKPTDADGVTWIYGYGD